jgi:hypothetical protein
VRQSGTFVLFAPEIPTMAHSEDNPLDEVRSAHEEEYFHKKNQELIARLRDKLDKETAAQALADKTGVNDPHLIAWLAELGFTADTVPVLHLVPLLQVAWADGEIQDEERSLLEQAAAEAGVAAGSPAHAKLLELLNHRPNGAFYDAAFTYIRVVLAAMPESEAAKARTDLQSLAAHIAKANGGLFGFFGRVSDEERQALGRISSQLGGREAATKVMGRV